VDDVQYIRVQWLHSYPDCPVEIYSEINEDRWELRKIEIFSDGRVGFADSTEETESTQLSVEPLPSLDEIAVDPQFVPREISKEMFESVWENRLKPSCPM
jgi:hypothetical protein